MNYPAIKTFIKKCPRLLLSGQDAFVQERFVRAIVEHCQERNQTLLVLDNAFQSMDGIYSHKIIEDGMKFMVFNPFLRSWECENKLRFIMKEMGFHHSDKLASYFDLIRHIEEKKTGQKIENIDMDIFQKYRASFLFQETIDSISELSERSRKYIETVYDETCESAAEFSQFVRISYPFLSGQEIPTKTEQIISYPLFRMEKDMASILLMLLRFKIMDFVCPPAVLILDKGGCFRKEVNNFILQLPGELYMVSDDIISGNEDFKKLESTFDAEIFSRHSSAQASQELENIFGSHPVRHVTYSIQRDRHWRANTPWDLLLGNDKTETVSTLQPVYEPNFRKELIESLPPGTVVIKFRGQHRMTTID